MKKVIKLSIALTCFLNIAYGQSLRLEAIKKGKFIGTIMNNSLSDNIRHDNDKPNTIIRHEFNALVTENRLKMKDILSNRPNNPFNFGDEAINKSKIDVFLRYSKEDLPNRKLRTRGHTVIWHNAEATPEWLLDESKSWTKQNVYDFTRSYIKALVGYCGNRIDEWDVLNEVIDTKKEDDFRRAATWFQGIWRSTNNLNEQTKELEDYYSFCLTETKKYAPNAQLFVNDYSVLANNDKNKALIAFTKKMRAAGHDLNIGFQGHLRLESIDRGKGVDGAWLFGVKSMIQELGKEDIDVAITECEIRYPINSTMWANPQLSAKEAYEKLISVTLSEPNCNTFMFWGISSKDSWIIQFSDGESAALLPFDNSFEKTPAYEGIYKGLQTLGQAENQLISNGIYYIKKADSTIYLNTGGSNLNVSSNGEIGSAYSQWVVKHVGNNVYELESQASPGSVLNVDKVDVGNVQRINTKSRSSATNFKWKAIKVFEGEIQLRPINNTDVALNLNDRNPALVNTWTTTNGFNENRLLSFIPTTPIALAPFIANGLYYIKQSSGSAYLNANGINSNASSDGQTGLSYSQWKVSHIGNNVYELESQAFPGSKLNVDNIGKGKRVSTKTVSGAKNIRWKAVRISNNVYQLRLVGDNSVALDLNAGNPAAVNTWIVSNTNKNQLLNFVPAMPVASSPLISDGNYFMKKQYTNVYINALGINKNVLSDGNRANLKSQWNFKHLGNDVYEIKSVNYSNARLEVPAGKKGAGQAIKITNYFREGLLHMQWKAIKLSSGAFQFKPLHDQRVALSIKAVIPNSLHTLGANKSNRDQLIELVSANSSTICEPIPYGFGGRKYPFFRPIEAENFDACRSGNSGQVGTYLEMDNNVPSTTNTLRKGEIVDLFSIGGNTSGIGWVKKGEYWTYSVSILKPVSAIKVNLRYASWSNGKKVKVELMSKGTVVSNSVIVDLPNTGSSRVFKDVVSDVISFPFSTNRSNLAIKITAMSNNFNFDKFYMLPTCGPVSFGNGGKSYKAFQKIEAENFDVCTVGESGNGFTYLDSDFSPALEGLSIRPNEYADIYTRRVDGVQTTGIGWIQPKEFWTYSIEVPDNATYIQPYVATASKLNGKAVKVELLSNNIVVAAASDRYPLPNTGNIFKYGVTGGYRINIPSSGVDRSNLALKVTALTNGFNFDFLYFRANGSSLRFSDNTSEIEEGVESQVSLYPNPVKDVLHVSLDNMSGSNVSANIYNMLGEQVSSFELSGDYAEVNISNFPKGVYVLSISDNNKTHRKRFLVE